MSVSPDIVLGRSDYRKLLTLGAAAEDLVEELARASVREDGDVPSDVVRMGSAVRYRAENGTERVVTLVYPAEADISAGKISVLTPIGTALLGLAVGQSIEFVARNGKEGSLSVLSVAEPASEAAA